MEENKNSSSKNITHSTRRVGLFLFRGIIFLSGVAVLISVAAVFFQKYQMYERLTYMTSDECLKHDYETQICETDGGSLYLRKVDMKDNRMSVSTIIDSSDWDSYKYFYKAFWFVDCDSGLQIETEKDYFDGSSMTLECVLEPSIYLDKSNSSRLEYSFMTSSKSNLEMNYGGFKISHGYSSEDYSPLLRHYMLNNQDIKTKRKSRMEKEAKEKQARLEREAKEKQARLEREAKEKQARLEREAKEREAKEREARLERAASCSEKNVINRDLFEERLEHARRVMLNVSNVWHHCGSQDAVSKMCVRYQLNVFNATDFPIKKVKIGYEPFNACSKSPITHGVIQTLIPQNTIHTALVIKHTGEDFCTKLLDVEFDAKYVPFDC